MDGSMNLADALGGGPKAAGGAVWPGGNTQPQWPGSNNPAWPAGQPANPTWPGGQPGQPGGQPQWPGGQPGQPGGQPQWPGGQPGQPQWPGAPGPNPTWPGQPGQPSAPGGWLSPAPGQAPSPVIPTAPQKSLAVPYEHALTHGVYDKLLITISGIIKHNPDRITLDFLTTSGDLAFHFNPRFKEGGRKVIVRNSRLSGKWGPEEREASSFPFTAGQAFEIKVMCTGQEFKVAVNGSHLLAYKHRMHNLTSITRLSVTNDLSLTSVTDTRLP